MSSATEKTRLRVTTYMCPSHPVQLYELVVELLETSLSCHATLGYESRVTGPFPDRPDPFADGDIDLAFMTAEAYMRLRDQGAGGTAELLPVTPVFAHDLNVDEKPGYFCDVIIHSDKKTHNVNSLLDLRGCTFAYSSEHSLSASKTVLKTLAEKGENATFFGSLLKSGSHLASAHMVLTKQAECAAVDSTTLLHAQRYMQDGGRDVAVLETLGRLPPYPVVVRAALPASTKKKIAEALLTLPHTVAWRRRFIKYGLLKFGHNSDGVYERTAAQVRTFQAHNLSVPYY